MSAYITVIFMIIGLLLWRPFGPEVKVVGKIMFAAAFLATMLAVSGKVAHILGG